MKIKDYNECDIMDGQMTFFDCSSKPLSKATGVYSHVKNCPPEDKLILDDPKEEFL